MNNCAEKSSWGNSDGMGYLHCFCTGLKNREDRFSFLLLILEYGNADKNVKIHFNIFFKLRNRQTIVLTTVTSHMFIEVLYLFLLNFKLNVFLTWQHGVSLWNLRFKTRNEIDEFSK